MFLAVRFDARLVSDRSGKRLQVFLDRGFARLQLASSSLSALIIGRIHRNIRRRQLNYIASTLTTSPSTKIVNTTS